MNRGKPKLNVAIIGSGNIGTDLLYKIVKSESLNAAAFVGRSNHSKGLSIAKELGILTSDKGVSFLKNNADLFDCVFDATSANSHHAHYALFESMGKKVIDLTPARLGKICVPSVNMEDCVSQHNVNMITCGGQSSIPIVNAVSKTVSRIDYVEVVSSISALSAGLATRNNIDEYINTTEYAICEFSSAKSAKAILNINPANPPVHMQTTIYVHSEFENPGLTIRMVTDRIREVSKYVPGYKMAIEPTFKKGYLIVGISVSGQGDFLPAYAGNLDIINCAAIAVAERFSQEAAHAERIYA